MGKRGHGEEEILRVLRDAESGETIVEVCRKHGISQQSFYLWKKKYSGLGLNELRELRQLRKENSKLKRPVAELSLDRHILREIVAKELYGLGGVARLLTSPPTERARTVRLIPVDRMTLRYGHHRDPQEALRVRLRELAGSVCATVNGG